MKVKKLEGMELMAALVYKNLTAAEYQSAPGVFWNAIRESAGEFLIGCGHKELVEAIDKSELDRVRGAVMGSTSENLLKAAAFMRSKGSPGLADRIEAEVAARHD